MRMQANFGLRKYIVILQIIYFFLYISNIYTNSESTLEKGGSREVHLKRCGCNKQGLKSGR